MHLLHTMQQIKGYNTPLSQSRDSKPSDFSQQIRILYVLNQKKMHKLTLFIGPYGGYRIMKRYNN